MDNNSNKNDEIDLVTIFNGLKGFIMSIWSRIVKSIFLVRKRFVLFLLFGLLGAASGYGISLFIRPTYVSSITISSKILTNDYCANVVENLGDIVNDKTPELLAKKLHINLAIASEIKKIEFSNYNEKLSKMYEDKDTIVLGIPFKIFVHSYNNSIFDSIEVALVKHLENINYALKRKEIKRKNIQLMTDRLNDETEQLDSLKKKISENIAPRGNPTGFVFGQPIDPINIYKAGIDIFQKKLNLNEEIELIDGIQVVDSFSPRDKPDSPKPLKLICLGVFISILVAFAIAFALERK